MTFVFIFGVIFALITLKVFINAIKFSAKSKVVRGEIVRFEESEHEHESESSSVDSDGATITTSSTHTITVYTPVIAYKAADGKTYEHSHTSASSHPTKKVGDKVKIAYLPSNPSESKEASFAGHWLPTIVCGTIAGLLLLASYQDVLGL